jgi:hypothetical protein
MIDDTRRDVLENKGSERGCGGLPDATRGTAGDRDIDAGRVEQMSARVAWTETILAPGHQEHGISDSIVEDDPVTIDVEIQSELMTNDNQLSSDQLGDWSWTSRPMVRTTERRLIVSHSNDELTRNSGPPGQNLEVRCGVQRRSGTVAPGFKLETVAPGFFNSSGVGGTEDSLLRYWRDPGFNSSGIGGIRCLIRKGYRT